MNTKKTAIGSNIKYIRERKGVTATHITSLMGYSPQWLNNIEKNRRTIKADDLLRIANILGVDIGLFYDLSYNETFKSANPDSQPQAS
jgi:transcriptional regulator with XRE-family HTH domain